MCNLKIPKTPNEILHEVRIIAYTLFLVNEESDFNTFIEEWIRMNPVYHYDQKTGKHITTYHNWCHMGHATVLAYQFASYKNLSVYDQTVLFFATMFHDFSHSFGELSDNENIQRALIEFEKYITTNDFCRYYYESNTLNSLYLRSSFVRDVFDTIMVTEYPFIHEAKTETQKIMRDVDLTMSLSPINIFADGLTNETKHRFGQLTRKTMAEFALQQHFYYPEFKKLVEDILPSLED